MSAPAINDRVQVEAMYERVERLVLEAAEAERAAFVAWQEAYGAYEVACAEASAARTAWAESIVP